MREQKIPDKPLYVRFQPTEESIRRSAPISYSIWKSRFAAISELWVSFWLILAVVSLGAISYGYLISHNSDMVGFGLFVGFIILITGPFALLRLYRNLRIFRDGVAVVGLVVSDQSPLATPWFGKGKSSKHKGLRMTYVYNYQGEQYTGITGDTSLKRNMDIAPIRSIPDATGACKIILIHPTQPNRPRATPEDVFLDKPTRKRLSEELGLICLA